MIDFESGTTIPEKPAYGLVFCFWGNGNPDVYFLSGRP